MSEITVHLQTADGRKHTISGRTGRSLMQAAVNAGIDAIAADCGGCLTCATCHVFIDAAWLDKLPQARADELDMLDSTAVQCTPNSRLSCQIELTPALDGLSVSLPATQY